MVIAINNCGFEDYDAEMEFVSDLLINVAPQYPENKFFFIMNRQPPKAQHLNIYYVQTDVTKKGGLLSGYQYQRAISIVLKKIKADLFLTPFIFSQLFFKRKQVLILPGLGNLIYASDFGKAENSFFNKYILQSVKKATLIITSSESWKKLLVNKFEKKAEEIFIISRALGGRDMKNTIGADIKKTYTNNDEYFLVVDGQINKEKIIFLLKSFSAFKKRLKSMMKMMFILNGAAQEVCEGLIKSYKYRSDIVVLNKETSPEISAVIRNAYAVIINSNFGGFEFTTIIMKCLQTAIISTENEFNKVRELAQDQGLYYKPNDIKELADQMMKIYKDENLRNSLIMRQKDSNDSINAESYKQELEKLFGSI